MNSRCYRVLGLTLVVCLGGLAAGAQEPLTLRQAIDQALKQSPQAAIARADKSDAKAAAAMARTQLLPQLGFTEDIRAVTIRFMPSVLGFGSDSSRKPILR